MPTRANCIFLDLHHKGMNNSEDEIHYLTTIGFWMPTSPVIMNDQVLGERRDEGGGLNCGLYSRGETKRKRWYEKYIYRKTRKEMMMVKEEEGKSKKMMRVIVDEQKKKPLESRPQAVLENQPCVHSLSVNSFLLKWCQNRASRLERRLARFSYLG